MPKEECIAMVLAGGRGKRLSVLTRNLAKPAVPFGARYRLIDFTLSNCHNSRINIIGVLTQYQPLVLHSHIGAIRGVGMACNGRVFILPPFLTADGGDWYKGTANAVFRNRAFLDAHQPRYVLVLSGDHIYKMDYRPMLEYHKAKQATVTIAAIKVPRNEAGRFGIMNIRADCQIYKFEEKPAQPCSDLASMGIYLFDWPVLKRYLQTDEKNAVSTHDFGKDVLPRMLQDGLAMYAYEFGGYWKDVGTVDSLWQAHMDLLGNEPLLNLHDSQWPIYTVDALLPPHFFAATAKSQHVLVGEGCQIYGEVYNSVLFSGVRVAAGAVVKNSVVMPNVRIGCHARLYTAIVGSDARIEEYCEIGRRDGAEVTVVSDSSIMADNISMVNLCH